jgi:hypothetical protein
MLKAEHYLTVNEYFEVNYFTYFNRIYHNFNENNWYFTCLCIILRKDKSL